jgi:hypothetical protein
VEAVREGLVHIVAVARARRKLPPGPGSGPGPTPGPGRGKIGTAKGKTGGSKTGSSAGSGDPTEATDEDATRQTDAPGAGSRDDALKALEKAIQRAVRSAEKMEDSGLSSEADQAASDMPYEIHVCIDSDAVEAAATGASVSSHDIHLARVEIQNQIDSAIEFEDGDLGRVHVMRSIRTLGNKRGYNRMADRVKTNETASRFIRDALLRSRTGRESVGRYQRHGRLDQRALHRVLGDDPQRVFEKKHRESPGRYLVWLMLDHSASMAGGPDRSTAEVATAFVNALQHVPTMRAEVWAWSDAFKAGIWGPGVVRAWKTGQPVSDIAKIVDLKYGGTPDSQILAWAYRSILKSVRTGETPVILFASDGQGHVSGMRQNVEKARALGVLVRSVAIGAINEEDQATIYGRHGYVPWAGTMTKTARAMAGMVARIVSGAER